MMVISPRITRGVNKVATDLPACADDIFSDTTCTDDASEDDALSAVIKAT
jgi:hypothetical protein